MKEDYLFTSERLGFRNWTSKDLTEFSALNADVDVMEHFPHPLTQNETSQFISRLQGHYEKNGYTYFATEVLKTGDFIGFIGFAFQDYKTKFTPATDIGWRLKKSAWGKGFATEGAKRCLLYGFQKLKLNKIISTCSKGNSKSEHVMKKIGMKKAGSFKHPKLKEYPTYEDCIVYEIYKEDWQLSK